MRHFFHDLIRVRKSVAGSNVTDYLYDLAGHETVEVCPGCGYYRAEVYAGSRHLATYVWGNTEFNHSDWLGTERARSNASGTVCETITSLPYGDNQSASGACSDSSLMHFTGKMRDAESNLDDFGARYYSSQWGRFMIPDWDAKPTGVPYAKFGDPQSLNLYAYVKNNPSTDSDADGHCDMSCVGGIISWAAKAIARDGSPSAVAKNLAIGAAKGAGSFAVDTLKTAVAVGQGPGNIPAAIGTLTTPGPAALQPSNVTQAQASVVTQITLTAASILTPGAASAASDAASVTAAGDAFFHYGFAADAESFANGLKPGGFATTEQGLTGAEAQSGLALTPRTGGPPNAVYTVTPAPGTPVIGPSTVQPAFGQPGGLPEVQFPAGTGPGTVSPPKLIPQGPDGGNY